MNELVFIFIGTNGMLFLFAAAERNKAIMAMSALGLILSCFGAMTQ